MDLPEPHKKGDSMAAYQSQFVASVICNNQPLREVNKNGRRTCIIPFDSEYKLRLKNQKIEKKPKSI